MSSKKLTQKEIDELSNKIDEIYSDIKQTENELHNIKELGSNLGWASLSHVMVIVTLGLFLLLYFLGFPLSTATPPKPNSLLGAILSGPMSALLAIGSIWFIGCMSFMFLWVVVIIMFNVFEHYNRLRKEHKPDRKINFWFYVPVVGIFKIIQFYKEVYGFELAGDKYLEDLKKQEKELDEQWANR